MKPVWRQIKTRTGRAGSILLLAVLLLLGSLCGHLPDVLAETPVNAPDQIVLTWTGDPIVSQGVTWLMSDSVMAQVQYLPLEDFAGDFTSAEIIEVDGSPFGNTHYRYQADISQLTPNTTYCYRVGCTGAWSEVLTFTTAEATERFSFLYLGDVQEGYTDWGNMLTTIKSSHPEIRFSLLGGDLTNKGGDEDEWVEFLDAATPYFSCLPMMPTLGNHDGEMYKDFFSLPTNGPSGLEGEFYSFDYGNAHFVVLDSNNNTNRNAREWLQADLQATDKTWKLVVFHHPAYPAFGDFKGIDESIQENWVPILEDNGVDMVFVGHQHQYMRTHPIYQGEILDDGSEQGIVYIMGNSGSKFYQGGSGFDYIADEDTSSNYQVIEIDNNVLTMTAKRADGQLIETYVIDKRVMNPPALKADTTNNNVGEQIDITFTDDEKWRGAISDITVNGVSIIGEYTIGKGLISIFPEVFTTPGDHHIAVKARGYSDIAVRQPIKSPIMLLSPISVKNYRPGENIIIQGTAPEIEFFSIRVQDPDGNNIYGPEEVMMENGEFQTSLNLPPSASEGTYRIVMHVPGISVPIINTFRVAPKDDEMVILTIKGDGVNKVTEYTKADLMAKEQVQARYSTINTWPTKKWYVAKGVKLADLLAEAGMTEDAKQLRFSSKDGYSMNFTVKELLEEDRWYYPGLKENHEYFGCISGSTADPERVHTILALQNAESADFDDMDDNNTPLLVMGQHWVSEQTNQAFVKYVQEIEVTTATPQRWESPVFTPPGGEVITGTEIELSTADMDGDNIYYTTDGSDPTYRDDMYNWIKKRWWNSRENELADINHPIRITQGMTIKAVVIGFGKEDSEIVTFHYQVTDPLVVINQPVNGQEFKKGQEVIIRGSSEEITRFSISIKNPGGNIIYGPEEIVLVNQLFTTGFTLGADTVAGNYTIILEAAEFGEPITLNFLVKDESGSGGLPDKDVVLTVSGDGVTATKTFTIEQLQELGQHQQVYSVINTWPTKKWCIGEGVKLAEILNLAGIRPNAQVIRFVSKDGFAVKLTVQELLNDKRYYFPGFKDGAADADGHIPGSAAGSQLVDSIIALKSAEGSRDPGYMNDISGLLLMMGQRAVTEQVGQLFVKGLSRIEVSASSSPRWDTPKADPAGGDVIKGALIKLSNNSMDDDKIYYTTDGSTPTIESPIYNWIASRWQSSREAVYDTINHPIKIEQDTTIKAVTIGPGKRDSEIATFTYKVKKDAANIVSVAKENTIKLGDKVKMVVPPNAIKGKDDVEIKITIVDSPGVLPDGFNLLSDVYEFSVDDSKQYSFDKQIKVTFKFDSSQIEADAVAAVHYLDEVLDAWINIGGEIDGNMITVEIDHFTKFAVMSIKKEETMQEPVKPIDIRGHWAQAEIEQLIAAGVIAGYPDGSFRPEKNINRAEFVTMLVKMLKPENQANKVFADTADHWARDYIASAVAEGMITGYNAGCFGPDDPITREQMGVILFRSSELPLVNEKMQFLDSKTISAWAKDGLGAVVKAGIMRGYPDNTIRPQNTATRAEAAKVLVDAFAKAE